MRKMLLVGANSSLSCVESKEIGIVLLVENLGGGYSSGDGDRV